MKDKFNMSLEANVFLAKRNLVDSIYKEALLEGIGVTFPETNEIFEGRSVSGLSVDDVVKINNLKHAWQFVFDTIDYPMDLRYIKQINKEVGAGLVYNCGSLRITDVSIGGTSWKPGIPDPDNCRRRIEEIVGADKGATEKAIDLMLFCMRSQMFHDGNKRTGQLAANQYLIQNGCGLISVPEKEMSTFLGMLVDYYETDNSRLIKDFIYENCIDGMDCPELTRSITETEEDEWKNEPEHER